MTMTIKELRDALGDFPGDMPVYATWEGQWARIERSNMSLSKSVGSADSARQYVLLIDVDNPGE